MSIALDVSGGRKASHMATGLSRQAAAPGTIEIGSLQPAGMQLRFGRNETIFSEGDKATHSYKVISGVIRLCKHMADGRRQIADFVQPGGYCGLLDPAERRFTAEAVGDVVVTACARRPAESLAETAPGMVGFLTQSLMGMQDHLVMLGRQTAKERVASFLLMLADRAAAAEGDAVELPMNRQDIADYLGLTIETVCRVLSDLKRSSLIELPNLHQAVLKDMDALHDLSDGDGE